MLAVDAPRRAAPSSAHCLAGAAQARKGLLRCCCWIIVSTTFAYATIKVEVGDGRHRPMRTLACRRGEGSSLPLASWRGIRRAARGPFRHGDVQRDFRWRTPTASVVRADGKVIQVGRQVAVAEGRIVGPDGKLYAHATTTCLIFEHRP